MSSLFSSVKHVLSLAFAGAVTFFFMSGFSPLSMAVLVFVVALFCYWFMSHKKELGAEYSATEQVASIPGKYDRQIWRDKPLVRDLAPGLVVVGFAGLYMASVAVNDVPKDRFGHFVYQYFGATGVVAVMSLIATICLVRGVELWLGYRSKRSNSA